MTTPDDDSPPTTDMADHEEDSAEGALHQCTVCDRKFNSQSYERHVKICERTAARKRKPFDSAKQRIQGTDLAEFQHTKPPETIHEHPTRRPSHSSEDKQSTSSRRASGAWKEKSEELRRSIKAVKDKTQQSTAPSQISSIPSSTQSTQHHQQQRPSTLSLVTSPGAPQRSNEKGTCPTCQRQFGVKSYDRHVAFCRERATRLPSSPQTRDNVAKERLDARMKYRAPGLKNRKPTNKEKYSPGGVQQQQKLVTQSPLMTRNKNNIDSPKLPQLKRPGQTKESPISTSGPLKSRPMDRSNRSSDSQESLNPPAMKQLVASRRLLLLSEVLPSKFLLSKNSLSSSSSQKSSARLVTNFLQKEFSEDSPYMPKAESFKQKLKKKIRFRGRGNNKNINPEEDDDEVEQIEMVTLTEQKHDYLTWNQIREEVRNNKHDGESIDKIEEPILSHRTGLSSHDDGNSTMDEFEMNEKMVRYHETEECFVIENNAVNEKNVENERNSDSEINRTYVIDDTATNEERTDVIDENKEVENANNESDDDDDDDDLSVASMKTFKKSDCQSENVDELEIHQPQQDIVLEITSENNSVTPRIDEISESKREDSNLQADKNDELTIVTNKIKEKLLSRPKKYLSLPNIAEIRQQRTPRVSRLNVEGAKIKEENIDELNKMQGNDPMLRNNDTRLPLINCPTQRCATYVVDKPSGDNGSKNKSLESRDSKLLYDYYRNASFSDLSSVRTEDLQITDYDFEDFTDGNESNASELLKEIDACLMNSNLLESQDSLVDFTRKPRTSGTRRCRNARVNESLDKRDEETSESTIELSDLRSAKPTHQFEKEICTITRLDSISRDGSSFLPPIAGNRVMEYRREKFIKSKPLRDIEERDTPRDDEDERFERFSKSRARSRKYSERRSHLLRSYERLPRCDLNSYIRRHPNFSVLLKSRIGNSYDPFYILAEQQMNDLFSDTSDQSSTDGSSICPPQKTNSSPNFPLSHSSAFAKYPTTNGTIANSSSQNQCQAQSLSTTTTDKQQPAQLQRASVIAPPTGFDDLTSSDLSSDCTETNSLSRELLTSSSNSNSLTGSRIITMNVEREHVLGRRIIIDQNQALGGGEFAPSTDVTKTNGVHSNSNGINSRLTKSLASCNRSNSMRAVSAPKPPERQISSSSSSTNSEFLRNNNTLKHDMARSANNFKNLNGSNVSLNSIFSSNDMEMKRSASLFDELLSSFEDDANSTTTLPSLMSLIRNDPLLSSAPQQNGHHQRTTNGRINCSDDDAELSSPESVKRQECGKLSADSAYSSLNRKYSNHGRSTNDVSSSNAVNNKYKMSKFCHECGFKFPDSAKFCCECGVRRLTL